MTSLRERNKSKRRNAILDATLGHLRERPFADVTVEEIARDAGVSPHTVYNLVGTRDEIMFALLGRVVREMAATSPAVEPGLDDPSEPLRVLFDHAVQALLAEPAAYREIVRHVAAHPSWPSAAARPPALVAEAARPLAERAVLRAGVQPATVARHAYAGFAGWLMTWANGFASDQQFRLSVAAHLDLILASTTTGAVHERAARSLTSQGASR